MALSPAAAHASQSEVIAEECLRSWFQNQVRTADDQLRRVVTDLTALSVTMLEGWGTSLDNVVRARRTLEDASAALGEAVLSIEAALRLAGPVAAAATGAVPPWSEYLHHEGLGGGQRAVQFLTAAASHLDRALNSLTDCSVRVRNMAHYFTGGALAPQVVPVANVDPTLDAVARFDGARARGVLGDAIGFLRQAVHSAGVARNAMV